MTPDLNDPSPLSPAPDADPTLRSRLEALLGRSIQILASAESDLRPDGSYGQSYIALTPHRLLVADANALIHEVPLQSLRSIHSIDRVGNGSLEVRDTDDRRRVLIRFTRTQASAFEAFAETAMVALVGHEATEVTEAEPAPSSGPRDAGATYRCPNCTHPLQNPKERCPKCSDTKKVMWRVAKLLLNYRLELISGTALGLVIVLINLAPAYLVRQLIDGVLQRPDLDDAMRIERLSWLVGAFFVLIAIRMGAQFLRQRIMGALSANVIRDLRSMIYRALQRLSLSYYDRSHTGRIMARVLNDTQGVQNFIVGGVQKLVLQGMMVIGIPIILLVENPKLAAVALAPIPLVILFTRHFARRYKSLFRAARRRFASLSALVAESISGMRVIRSFAQEEREVTGFDARNRDVHDAQIAAVRTRAVFNPSVLFMITVGTVVVWWLGGRMVVRGEVSLGMLVQFIAYMNMFYNPVQMLIELTESFQSTASSAERVFGIIDMPSEVADHDGATELSTVDGEIVFENVSFKYATGDTVLSGLDLTIRPGEMIGLVGHTGSGKSTIASLVCRFYDPTEGRVMLDGVDLQDIQQRSLRSQIGMVLQDTILFAGTIRDNIAYGRPKSGLLEVIQAAKAANAHGFIMELSDGYDTLVGERGSGLSGGEKQRLAIARAILKDPAILILDEATSAVDTATERSIQDAMDRLITGRTTIAIAHRLSTLRNADRILVMENGVIIEQGSHEELLARDGAYAGLVHIQSDDAPTRKELQTA